MKLIMFLFLSSLFISNANGQKQTVQLKGKAPLQKGYYEYYEPANGIYISRSKFVTLFSDCDSVYSTESGTIISISNSQKDSSQKLIIKSGNLRLFYCGLKQLNVKNGDRITANQFIGLAKQIKTKTFSITVQVGDKKNIVWGREKQETYLKGLEN